MERLVATNDLERYRLDLAASNTPAGLQTTLSGEEFRGLPKGVRHEIFSQSRRGGLNISAGQGGSVVLTPTNRGTQGDLQAVQRSKSGVWSSSSSGIGAPAPPYHRPGIIDLGQSYFEAVAQAARAAAAGG
jgi:hypothetical protein